MPQTVNIQGFGKVHFPDGMSPDQIQMAIEMEILPNHQKPAAPEVIPAEKPSALVRFGRGASDVTQGIGQRILQGVSALPQATPSIQELRAYASPEEQKLSDEELRARFQVTNPADAYTAKVNDELALYDKGRQGEGFDWWRLGGNVAAATPLMFAGPSGTTAGARAIAGGVQGALGGAAQFNPSGKLSDTAINTAVGGAAGAALAPVLGWTADKAMKLGQRLAGWYRGARATNAGMADILKAVPELQELPEGAQRDLIAEAQDMISRTGKLDAQQIARKANILAQGATPTKAMVTRDPGDWTREANLQKLLQSPDENLRSVAQQLTQVRQGNDAAFAGRLRSFSEGMPQGTPEALGMNVMRSLDDLSTASQEEVGKLYSAVRQAKGDHLASDARNLASTLDDLRDNTYAEKLVSSVTNKLRRFGMLDKEGNLTAKTLTVSQAEELRKFVNKLPNDYGKRDIIQAIDSDVLSGMGEDAFAGARKAAQDRFAMLGNPTTQKALGALGELSQGKTAQNFIQSQVISAPEQDVASLIGTLSNLPQDQAASAMSSIRSGVLQHLEAKAINPNSGQFSGAKLSTAIREIGEGKLIRILGMEQYKHLQNLARAGLDATYEPAYSAVNHSNTAPMLLSLMRGARAIPGVPLLVTENAEKIAARSGYQAQLAEALAATPRGQLPPVSPRMQELANLLTRTGAQASPAAVIRARERRDSARQ